MDSIIIIIIIIIIKLDSIHCLRYN